MDINYFQKINNTYNSKSRQETDLYLLNRHVDDCFADTIDYHVVKRNGEPFELLIIKDSDGNTFKKKIKSKHSEPFNLGDYIEWNNQLWLVTLLDPNDKTYHSGYMYLCNLPLRWQREDGEIIERYVYAEDFTKYSNGISSNNTLRVGDNQYGITAPIDDETKKLHRDMRFCIDLDDSLKPDIYKLTNRKVYINNNEYFGRGGTMILTFSFDSFNSKTDKQVLLDNGKKVWICDYFDPSSSIIQNDKIQDDEENLVVNNYDMHKDNKTQTDNKFQINNNDDILSSDVLMQDSIICNINGNTKLKIGYPRKYEAILKDCNGNLVQWDNSQYIWSIICSSEIVFNIENNTIELLVENEDMVHDKIKIQVCKDDNEIGSLIVDIVGAF